MRILTAVVAATAVMLVPAGAAAQAAGPERDPRSITLQNDFDHIGAEVHSLTHAGRTSYYIDEGKPGQRAVVFMGGQGTSLEAFQLTEFARTSREELGLRVISVERNGFGESELDLDLGYPDYNAEVLAVLDHLGIDRFAILGISGGGAYAAHLAAAVPGRVISLHAAAATSSTLPTRAPRNCTPTFEERNASNAFWYANPKAWWGVPGSPVLVIPGWQATAYLDAVRSFYLGGGLGDPSALSHEGRLPCGADAIVDSDAITSPADPSVDVRVSPSPRPGRTAARPWRSPAARTRRRRARSRVARRPACALTRRTDEFVARGRSHTRHQSRGGTAVATTTATREQWLAARKELLELEKEFTRRSDELARRRRELPRVRVDEDYAFETDEGTKTLAELFGGRSQLIVYHFMHGPNTPDGCVGCTFATDSFNGVEPHLDAHDVTFVLASRSPLETLNAYKQRMGWSIPWVSCATSDFNRDFSAWTEEDRRNGTGFNFGTPRRAGVDTVNDVELMALSVFELEEGVVYHTYTCYDRGTDVLNVAWQLLDRTPKGRDQGAADGWPRRRDEYGDAART